MKTEIERVAPIAGAAKYTAYGKEVYMKDTDGYESCIEICRTVESAVKKAIWWQKRENKSVSKLS